MIIGFCVIITLCGIGSLWSWRTYNSTSDEDEKIAHTFIFLMFVGTAIPYIIYLLVYYLRRLL